MASKILFISGFILACVSLLCTLIAFASPNWIESFEGSDTRQFLKMGLWEACFDDWTYYKDYMGKTYDGCWWIFSFEYRPILTFLLPGWMIAVQVLVTMVLLIHLISPILMLLQLIGCCPGTKAPMVLIIDSILMFSSGMLIAIAVMIFGVQSDSDRQWLPRPDQNYLSWAFGFCVFSGFLSLFSAMCLFVDGLRVREIKKRDRMMRPPAYERANRMY